MVDIKRLTLSQALLGVLLVSIEVGFSTAIITYQWKTAIVSATEESVGVTKPYR